MFQGARTYDAGTEEERPNALRVSRRLERMILIDRESTLAAPEAKMAPIQPVGYIRLLGRNPLHGF
jgi:hypothetical protein